MQKFLVSKLAGSSVGQDVIASAVDEGTRHIVDAFIKAVKQCKMAMQCSAMQCRHYSHVIDLSIADFSLSY